MAKKSIDAWIEPDGDKWRVRYRDAWKRKKSEGSFDTENEAGIAYDNLIVRLKLNRIDECDPNMKLADAFELYRRDMPTGMANKKGRKMKASSIGTITSHIRPLLERAKVVSDLEDQEMLIEWVAELTEDGLAEWSIYGILKDCAAFAHYMRRKGMITFDPFETIPRGRPDGKPRFYTDEQLEALEKAAEGDPMHLWLRLGYQAGLRYSEILNAHWQNITLNDDGTGEFTIWGHQSKNRKSRTVPLSSEVVELLGSRRDGLLFPNWTRGVFRYQWAKLKHAAGIVDHSARYLNRYGWSKADVTEKERADFHRLRHTFCKLFLQNGGYIEELQKISGHKSVQVLIDTYSHFEIRHLSSRVEAIVHRPKFPGQWRGKTSILDIKSGQAGSQPVIDEPPAKKYNQGEN